MALIAVLWQCGMALLLWARLTDSTWAKEDHIRKRDLVERGEIDPDNTDFEGPNITFCPEDIHITIEKCDEATEATVTWEEPTAIDKVSTVELFDQNHHSGDSFPLNEPGDEGHLVYYDFIDEAENIESCLFKVLVTREQSDKECVPDCIIGKRKRIPSRSTFLTSDCSQRCTCEAGTLVCEDYGCGKMQVCGKVNGRSRKCYCRKGYKRDKKTGECYKKCRDGFFAFKTSCYQYHPEKKNFKQARKTCLETMRTDLVTISSQEENDFVHRLIEPSSAVWLGAKSNNEFTFNVRTNSPEYSFVKELTPDNHRVEFFLQTADESRILLNNVPSKQGTIYEFVFTTSKVSLKLCKNCETVMTSPLPVNISSSGASLFISVKEGVISIGESGRGPFVTWVHRTRNPFPVAYVGIASKKTAVWHFFDRFSWMRKAEQWTFENWSSKEPNSYDERRACAVMKGDCGGQWSDTCCSFQKSFICEQK